MFCRLIYVADAGSTANSCYSTPNYHFRGRSLRMHSQAHVCNFLLGFIFFALFGTADSTLVSCQCAASETPFNLSKTILNKHSDSQSLKLNALYFSHFHNTGTILNVANVLEFGKKSQICKCTLLGEANVKTWWSR